MNFKLNICLATICIGTSTLFIGCNDDPIQSLKNNQVSVKYSAAFWDQQYQNNTTLWTHAVTVCNLSAYQESPNCKGVRDIAMFSNPTDFPTYGSGKGFGQTTLSSKEK